MAKIVREGLDDGQGQGEFTENGFMNSEEQKNEVVEKKNDLPTWAIVLIVIACVICSPVILGAAGSLLGVLVGIAAAILGIIVGFGATAIILYIVAVALVIAGFGCIISAPLSGIGMIGGGCICAAIGILFMLLTVFIVGKCVPGICQGIAYIFRSLFGKKKGAKA